MNPSVTDHAIANLVARTHAEGILDIAAAALLEHEGRFLLVETTPPDFDTPPGWELPTGRIRPGETVLDGLERMLQDSFALDLNQVTAYLGSTDHHDGTRIFVFAVTCTRPDAVCRSAHIGHRWIDPVTISATVDHLDHLLRNYYADSPA